MSISDNHATHCSSHRILTFHAQPDDCHHLRVHDHVLAESACLVPATFCGKLSEGAAINMPGLQYGSHVSFSNMSFIQVMSNHSFMKRSECNGGNGSVAACRLMITYSQVHTQTGTCVNPQAAPYNCGNDDTVAVIRSQIRHYYQSMQGKNASAARAQPQWYIHRQAQLQRWPYPGSLMHTAIVNA